MSRIPTWLEAERELIVGIAILVVGLSLIAIFASGPDGSVPEGQDAGEPGEQTQLDGGGGHDVGAGPSDQTQNVVDHPTQPDGAKGSTDGSSSGTSSGTGSSSSGDQTTDDTSDAGGGAGGSTDPGSSPGAGGSSSALPDLVVTSIDWSPSDPQDGDDVTFTATVRNADEDSAGGTIIVKFVLDGETFDELRTHAPDPGGTVSATSKAWTAEAGDHEVEAIADPEDTVEESDEDNNGATQLVEVDRRLLTLPGVGDSDDGGPVGLP